MIENDIAKALGNALNVLLENGKDIICIDGIYANDGDYIDIGEPVAMGRVVPVVTKTLIFNLMKKEGERIDIKDKIIWQGI